MSETTGDVISAADAEPEVSRRDFAYARSIPTRWLDGDPHGHVNNVQYYSYFDTLVTEWLMTQGGLDVLNAPVLGLCVESACTFRASITFPEAVEGCLRVGRVGRSSVRYEVALFRAGHRAPAAEGHFVHVYVDRESRRPVKIPTSLRGALAALEVTDNDRAGPPAR